MDLNALQQKLDTLQNQKPKSEKKDFSKIYWKPQVGDARIRILPSAYNSNSPFTEVKIHYGIGNPVMISPLNFGEKDPIAQFAEKLRQGEYNKDNYILSKKLDPKVRTFVPVIVKGEEEKGVRLWQFGTTMYQDLINLALDPEVGDYTDITNGRDIKVKTVGPETTGTKYNKSTVSPGMSTSPLSEDKNLVEKWLKDQPNPMEQFKRYSYDEMKQALTKWLTPEDEQEGAISSEPSSDFEDTKQPSKTTNYSLDTSKAKKSKEDEFDGLFGENGSKGLVEDDLPI